MRFKPNPESAARGTSKWYSWRLSLQGVYFVKWGDFIKIGSSQNILIRLRGLICSIPTGEFEPLGWIQSCTSRGSHWQLEAQIHELFREQCTRGEWFHDCEVLRQYIKEHAQPWPTRDIEEPR